MKYRYLYIVSLLIVLSAQSINLSATHFLGGEITWKCLSNGKFVFTITAYRDCNGALYDTVQTLTTTSPAVNISLIRVPGYPQDISPVCNNNQNFPHINCNLPYGFQGVSVYKWQSAPIVLNGIPPDSGWVFTWSGCCNSNFTKRLIGTREEQRIYLCF